MTIGVAGQGFLDITGGGRISVGSTTTPGVFTSGNIRVGDASSSQGVVNVNGFASILETQTMTFGDAGNATVNVSDGGTLRSRTAKIGNAASSIARVTLTGLGTRWINSEISSDDFVVGVNGRGTLEILDQAMVLNDRTVTIGQGGTSRGTARVSGAGSLWQIGDGSGTDNLDVGDAGSAELFISNGGLVRVDDETTVAGNSFIELSSGGILNSGTLAVNGVIRGDGRIESEVTINASGELRNAAGISGLRQYMRVTGDVTNSGTIESLGGEMEFQGAVTNNLEVIARDAILRFNGGFTNAATGDLVLGGDTTIHSPGVLLSEGGIHVLSGSEALIVGDLTFAALSTLSLAIGADAGTLDVVGTVDISMAMLELDYSAGVASQAGDTYQILSSTEPIMGMFLNPLNEVSADGQIWNITGYGTNAIFVTSTGLAVPTLAGDFDGDDDIDGFDFLQWQRGLSSTGPLDPTDLADWEAGYGMPAPLAAATGAVPEPSAIALLLLGGVLIAGRRSRKTS